MSIGDRARLNLNTTSNQQNTNNLLGKTCLNDTRIEMSKREQRLKSSNLIKIISTQHTYTFEEGKIIALEVIMKVELTFALFVFSSLNRSFKIKRWSKLVIHSNGESSELKPLINRWKCCRINSQLLPSLLLIGAKLNILHKTIRYLLGSIETVKMRAPTILLCQVITDLLLLKIIKCHDKICIMTSVCKILLSIRPSGQHELLQFIALSRILRAESSGPG